MGSLRVAPTKLDTILQMAAEPVFWANSDRKLLGVNRAWETFTGRSLETVVGLDCRSIGAELTEDSPSIVAGFHVPQEALEGRSVSSEALVRRSDGERVWKRIDFTPLHHAEGDLSLIVGFVREKTSSDGFPTADSDRLRVELLQLRDRRRGRAGLDLLIGKGDAHRRLLDQIETAARTSTVVLIVGEPGTGKRLVARTIHQRSGSEPGSLFSIDCEALPADLLARALFGALDDDDRDTEIRRINFPEHATLLLENGLSLPRDLQEQIVAADRSRIRWIVTTSFDPETARREERLRSDFYHRITTLVIRLAPLRDRIEELPLLSQSLLESANLRVKTTHAGFTNDAIEALMAYDWPGNLHELSRIITAAKTRALGDRIERKDLPAAIQGHFASAYLPPAATVQTPPATLDELLEQ